MSTEQTQEEFDAAEEAAFNQGFTEAAAESGLEVAAAPVEAAPEPEPTAPEPELTAPETPAGEPEVAPKPVLAGLTEDQVAVALSRVSQQQATIDKLGGRIGQLMQQVEALKNTPKTAVEQRSFDVKLTKLGEAFPELAELLREDLKGMSPGEAAEPAPSFTAEDVDAIVSNKLTQFQHQQERGLEVRMLGAAHPDWQDVIRTPQFALWRDNVIEDGRELMESENAQHISLRLTQFKDWIKATTMPPPAAPAPAAAAATPNRQRLANAVMPRGTNQTKSSEVSEEDAFALGFKNERARSGH